jgi:hypothetical protein
VLGGGRSRKLLRGPAPLEGVAARKPARDRGGVGDRSVVRVILRTDARGRERKDEQQKGERQKALTRHKKLPPKSERRMRSDE